MHAVFDYHSCYHSKARLDIFSYLTIDFSISNLPSCAEVLFVSTIFAVQQMPVFGDGLVESNCTACFLVDTMILPEFSVLCIGTILNVGVNVWLYRKTHGILFSLP